MKVSDHWVRSPLLNITRACQVCHPYAETEIQARVDAIQDRTHALLERSAAALTDMLDAVDGRARRRRHRRSSSRRRSRCSARRSGGSTSSPRRTRWASTRPQETARDPRRVDRLRAAGPARGNGTGDGRT